MKSSLVVLCVLVVVLVSTLVTADEANYGPYSAHPDYRYGKRPPNVRDPKLRKVYELFYPYYQRPNYRYPFYDGAGNGELLYGYGGKKLYRYTVFKPVEGYLRR
ncbi:unnamed protein product [Meganyctiphanes norvegica]|uniref:Uncharacterized protein n=1 Tax=Meganyctiphanes norvegica TaxID=48144 RepID=A0AAV2R1J0_MEGNR